MEDELKWKTTSNIKNEISQQISTNLGDPFTKIFGDLIPHVKFQKSRTTPPGRKVT
jgi:hypothetical protein